MFVYDTYSRGSVLLWRRSDTLCTSGFMDDVKFAHKPRLLDVAAQQLKRSAHAALGLAINCSQQYQLQANGRTGLLFGALKITSQVAAPWAESSVTGLLPGHFRYHLVHTTSVYRSFTLGWLVDRFQISELRASRRTPWTRGRQSHGSVPVIASQLRARP